MKEILRVIGPLLIVTGVIFLIVGAVSFFSSFGSFGPPKYFWCWFVGIPLLGAGVGICKFAYLRPLSNYMASETKEAVGTVAGTVAREVGKELNIGRQQQTDKIRCHTCHYMNEADAKFCSSCGTALKTTITCPACNEPNDSNAKFCDNCGTKLT